MVKIESAILPHQTQVVGRKSSKTIQNILIFLMQFLEDLNCFLGPINDGVNIVGSWRLEEIISFFRRQAFIDPSGNSSGAMDSLSSSGFNYFLSEFSENNAMDSQLTVEFGYTRLYYARLDQRRNQKGDRAKAK